MTAFGHVPFQGLIYSQKVPFIHPEQGLAYAAYL